MVSFENFEDILQRAKEGDSKCIKLIVDMYTPIVMKQSKINSALNADCCQELYICIIECILKFKLKVSTNIVDYL